MTNLVSIITWALVGIGAIAILIAFITFKRKDEFELSSSVVETTTFRAGAIILVIGLLAKLISAVMNSL